MSVYLILWSNFFYICKYVLLKEEMLFLLHELPLDSLLLLHQLLIQHRLLGVHVTTSSVWIRARSGTWTGACVLAYHRVLIRSMLLRDCIGQSSDGLTLHFLKHDLLL